MSALLDTFPLETQRLLMLVEGNLYYIATLPMTREQAMTIQQKMALPLGSLASKHGFVSSGKRRQLYRDSARKNKSVDNDLE